MKILLLLSLLVTPLFAKTEKELLALAKLEHSRERLMPELKVFPNGREFNTKFRYSFPENLNEPISMIAKEKTVKGKYIVTEMSIGELGNKISFLMVTTYSHQLKSYQKWVLNKTASEVSEYVGIRTPNTRIVSWMMIASNAKIPTKNLYVEVNNDNGVSWVDYHYKKGKLFYSIIGSAIKIK